MEHAILRIPGHTAPMSSLRNRLRAGTRVEHERIERALGFTPESLTLADYHGYLRRMHSFHAAMEPALLAARHAHPPGLALEARVKTPWLAEDLRHFGLEPLPPPPWNRPAFTVASVLGTAYVLEGATLGGRVLLGRVEERWGFAPGSGASYLAGYRGRTGSMWAEVVRALDAMPLRAAEEEECLDAARGTFRRLEAWLAT